MWFIITATNAVFLVSPRSLNTDRAARTRAHAVTRTTLSEVAVPPPQAAGEGLLALAQPPPGHERVRLHGRRPHPQHCR